jgi:hypothetical protein
MFLDAKKPPSTHHDLPRNHHNFTTKTPHQNTAFRKNPQQKRPSTTSSKKMRPGKSRTASFKLNQHPYTLA